MQEKKFVYRNRNAARPAIPAPIILCFAAPTSVRPAAFPAGAWVAVAAVVPDMVDVDIVEAMLDELVEAELLV